MFAMCASVMHDVTLLCLTRVVVMYDVALSCLSNISS